MASVLEAAIGAVVGIIGIVVFVEVYHAIPITNFSGGSVAMLNLVDLVLAAVIIISIIVYGLTRGR